MLASSLTKYDCAHAQGQFRNSGQYYVQFSELWKLEESQQAETCQLHREEPERGMEPRTFLLRGDWHSQHVNKAYSSCWPCRFHSQSFRALPANPASGGIRHWRISNSNIVTQYWPRNVLLGFIIILWNVNIYPKDNQRKSTFSKEQFYTGACTSLSSPKVTSGTPQSIYLQCGGIEHNTEGENISFYERVLKLELDVPLKPNKLLYHSSCPQQATFDPSGLVSHCQ